MKYAFLFWVLVLISLSNDSNASAREANHKADDIANDLRYGRPVRSEAVKEMFNNLKAAAVAYEMKSDNSKDSVSTTTSSSTEGLITGIEFISLLRELASTVDPAVFEDGAMLIFGKLT